MLTWLIASAHAFCGFYVGGAGADLYNDATVVVMMRDGSRTVLSMQNDYTGPTEDFAMVVPVPEVLDEEDVRTLPREVFAKIDTLAAPRLVEYWEGDPCMPLPKPSPMKSGRPTTRRRDGGADMPAAEDLGVTVEAEFAVGEYDIVILSAKDSSGLDTWLRREGYNIPTKAETVLRGYVAQGTKFFVAKVDPERVTWEGDRAVLSPLRIAYDDERFGLPVRLGMLNARGAQDLIVHILGKNQRYELANKPNVTIPTNLRVQETVKKDFGGFYEAVLANTFRRNPKAVVTEYSWQSGSCDPCPGPTMQYADIATLGGDLLGDSNPMTWTLTRLHARYTSESLGEDLVFRTGDPVIGGRGMPDAEGRFTEEVQAASTNQFQGRYAILHPWEGKVACENPRRGHWGGPPNGPTPRTDVAKSRLTTGAVKPSPNLASLLLDPIPGVKPGAAADKGEPGLIPEMGE